MGAIRTTTGEYPRLRTEGGIAPRSFADRLWRLFNLWMDRRCQRVQLARMDDRMLQDIGIDRAGAIRESRKPFWVA